MKDDSISMQSSSANMGPMDIYSSEKKAGFLLSNAVDTEDYAAVRKTVEEIGLNPDKIPHLKPMDIKEIYVDVSKRYRKTLDTLGK